ncbi:hypothetical protein Tco_1091562 [Tanacetum coccineum]|uniref:Uncharacterized protein n=1 Tax=Tanacetum coccineum TaxID=301880 RepID=A0ABQ5I8K9_9ASTR
MTCLSIYKLVRSAPDGCFGNCGRKAQKRHPVVRPKRPFLPTVFLSKNSCSNHDSIPPTCPLLWVIRGGETIVTPYLSMTFANWSLQNRFRNPTYDGTRQPNLAKRDLRNLQTTRASLVGSLCSAICIKETGIKDLFGSEICTMVSPAGSNMARHASRMVESSLPCTNTARSLDSHKSKQERGPSQSSV